MSTRPHPTTTDASVDRAEGDRIRRRVKLHVDITSRVGQYRDGLDRAAERLTDHEATIIADLERHGLDVLQLREVLWGGHVLVDDPELYERWRFPKSRERLSSHHKTVDKERHPDLGLVGPPGSARKMFLRSRANSIEGGTSEIQRNIIGERVLGLPGEPRTDKDGPWKDVPRS